MSFLKTCRKIIGIGKNYADHAKEMGGAVPSEPMIFLKPTSSFITEPGKIEIPENYNVHHEIELGVVIGKTGRDIKKCDSENYVAGYCLALDMTARNLQNDAKKNGTPWTLAKGLDTFTPIGEFIEKSKIKDPHNLKLELMVDGELRQNGSTKDMVYDIPALIEYISKRMTLEKGDLILTGTPAGVGPVNPGQTVVGKMSDSKKLIAEIEFTAIKRH